MTKMLKDQVGVLWHTRYTIGTVSPTRMTAAWCLCNSLSNCTGSTSPVVHRAVLSGHQSVSLADRNVYVYPDIPSCSSVQFVCLCSLVCCGSQFEQRAATACSGPTLRDAGTRWVWKHAGLRCYYPVFFFQVLAWNLNFVNSYREFCSGSCAGAGWAPSHPSLQSCCKAHFQVETLRRCKFAWRIYQYPRTIMYHTEIY